VQDDVLGVADLLIDEELLHVGPLVAAELDDLPGLLVLLDGAVAAEVLLEGLADPLHVEVVRESRHRRDALPPVPLLDPDVDLLLRGHPALVSRVLEGV